MRVRSSLRSGFGMFHRFLAMLFVDILILEQARLRDDNRCMLTGSQHRETGFSGEDCAQAVHIIPELTDNSVGLGEHGGEVCVCSKFSFCQSMISLQHSQAAAWSVLSTLSDVNIIEELAGNHINRLENIVSMTSPFCLHFGRLYLWLKPVEVSSSTLFLVRFHIGQ